jgi:hypothetical protein
MLYWDTILPVFGRGILPDTASINMEGWYSAMLVMYQKAYQ